MPASPAKPPSTKPIVRFRMRITAGETIAIGPGKIRLLEAIAETGSLTAAAKSIDMSYRRAWILINELNGALKQPAVESAKGGEHGGGSHVTAVGLQLIERYRKIEATAAASCKAEIQALTRLLGSPAA
ncbi:winged helix-turn-helix domain-containing protein [Variovorax saccharolyticus]|uniref:winged helix-turn-helix domain-containing protein n=1 Tax=Variovorax saccharolyticus TaxID=3053516 RepID=UPI002575AC46|nr:winged helix-turn-helix domain-containing protein [Variovorax sp. J31P216]MDM0025270.1 winged helix-turn-helix domain-containing protein [Variovorax sp. J31P216]